MVFDLFTVAGMIGTTIVCGAYLTNQQGWLGAEDWRDPLANLVGAVLILISLITAWNLPSAMIEMFWAVVSLHSLIKRTGAMRRH